MKAMLAFVWAGALAAGPAAAVLPEDIAAGTRVKVEGTRSERGEVAAKRIALRRAAEGTDQVEAAVDSVDAASRSLVAGGVRIAVEAGARLRDGDEATTDLGRLRPGREVEAEGHYENGVLRATSLEASELEADEVHAVEIEGAISEVDPASSSFHVLGQRVVVTPGTRVRIH